jgi:hypothetical protein
VPREGQWREVLNSDSAIYGGSGIGNLGAVASDAIARARAMRAVARAHVAAARGAPLAAMKGNGEGAPRTQRSTPQASVAQSDAPGAFAPAQRRRVIIENVSPCVDGGRFPAKRCAGDRVVVEADIFADGHDVLRCVLQHRRGGVAAWTEVEMKPLGNDRWRAQFNVPDVGTYEYAVVAWTDKFATWRHELPRWTDAADIESALEVGAAIMADLARRARGPDARSLQDWGTRLAAAGDPIARRIAALDEELAALAMRYADRRLATTTKPLLSIAVEPRLAGFSSWYEMFPRSAADGRRHGTFADVEALLPYVADMGFDVLYLPPIHPIGTTKRKGRNNALVASPGEPGSPWAIGAAAGGHKSIHPELGSEADFRHLVEAARAQRIEIALDIAFQTSPITRTWTRIRSGSAIVPTAPSASPRIRRRSTRTSIRSTSSPPTGRRCGRSFSVSSRTGSTPACACSASTTRTPSRFRCGSGSSARSRRSTRRSCSWRKPSRGRTPCTGSPRSASRSRTRTSRGATPRKSSPNTSRSFRRTRRAIISGPTCGRTRPTS